ncbi:MAG: hypothetical protein ACRD7E_20275 [Bryobacteraceae bacterium]
MNKQIESAGNKSGLTAAIAEAEAVAREQVAAAWQLHIDRVREQLEAGWREQIEHIFEGRFAEIQGRMNAEFDRVVSESSRERAEKVAGLARSSARRELTEHLNQAARRLKQAENRDVWIRTLLDTTRDFCGRAVLFAVAANTVKFEGATGIAPGGWPEVPLSSSPAFENVVEMKDTVVALGTRKELSDGIADVLGEAPDKKIYLFPLVVRQEVVAVLYAEPGEEPPDVSALELLTSLAAASMEAAVLTVTEKRGDLVRIAGAEQPAGKKPSAWSLLPKPEQEIHLRAQRFARTQAAQIMLNKVEKVRAGRTSHDLYSTLKEEIDSGRESFRQQYMSTCESMVDYYHLEIVRALANEDSLLLGPDYPGPLP